MTEEKSDALERRAHKLALDGRAVAVLSTLFLVPYLRRRREQRRARSRGRFTIFGH